MAPTAYWQACDATILVGLREGVAVASEARKPDRRSTERDREEPLISCTPSDRRGFARVAAAFDLEMASERSSPHGRGGRGLGHVEGGCWRGLYPHALMSMIALPFRMNGISIAVRTGDRQHSVSR